ncbi:MAG: polyhydroxyalkanoate synthesis repressor PhaR [Alphaproteobacteria bacterium]|nr:polyhydroxyalkanoate synthesis repressor PhaR [Alphaproteobacteria bacterium]
MARTNSNDPIVIKKYANRRLYDTSTSAYVTLEHLSSLVREGRDFVVQDAKSGEDITRTVLAQIIFEQENQKDGVLPVSFLRQLISLYGDSLNTALPAYLELSMQTFTAQQEKWRSYMSSALGEDNPARTLNDQVLKNIEMFEDAMRYFTPFAAKPAREEDPPPPPPPQDPSGDRETLIALQEQMAEMQRQISRLAASRPQQKD